MPKICGAFWVVSLEEAMERRSSWKISRVKVRHELKENPPHRQRR